MTPPPAPQNARAVLDRNMTDAQLDRVTAELVSLQEAVRALAAEWDGSADRLDRDAADVQRAAAAGNKSAVNLWRRKRWVIVLAETTRLHAETLLALLGER